MPLLAGTPGYPSSSHCGPAGGANKSWPAAQSDKHPDHQHGSGEQDIVGDFVAGGLIHQYARSSFRQT
jgi:hypothetical protein